MTMRKNRGKAREGKLGIMVKVSGEYLSRLLRMAPAQRMSSDELVEWALWKFFEDQHQESDRLTKQRRL